VVVLAVVVTVNMLVAAAGEIVAVPGDMPHVAGLAAPIGPATAQVRLTDPVKLPTCARVIVELFPAAAPAAKVRVAGVGVAVKPVGAALMTTLTAAELLPVKLLSPPYVAMMPLDPVASVEVE
jgi:hypothetical protein